MPLQGLGDLKTHSRFAGAVLVFLLVYVHGHDASSLCNAVHHSSRYNLPISELSHCRALFNDIFREPQVTHKRVSERVSWVLPLGMQNRSALELELAYSSVLCC